MKNCMNLYVGSIIKLRSESALNDWTDTLEILKYKFIVDKEHLTVTITGVPDCRPIR